MFLNSATPTLFSLSRLCILKNYQNSKNLLFCQLYSNTSTFTVSEIKTEFLESTNTHFISHQSNDITYNFWKTEHNIAKCFRITEIVLSYEPPERDSGTPSKGALGILQARTLEWVAISFSKNNYINSLISIN